MRHHKLAATGCLFTGLLLIASAAVTPAADCDYKCRYYTDWFYKNFYPDCWQQFFVQDCFWCVYNNFGCPTAAQEQDGSCLPTNQDQWYHNGTGIDLCDTGEWATLCDDFEPGWLQAGKVFRCAVVT